MPCTVHEVRLVFHCSLKIIGLSGKDCGPAVGLYDLLRRQLARLSMHGHLKLQSWQCCTLPCVAFSSSHPTLTLKCSFSTTAPHRHTRRNRFEYAQQCHIEGIISTTASPYYRTVLSDLARPGQTRPKKKLPDNPTWPSLELDVWLELAAACNSSAHVGVAGNQSEVSPLQYMRDSASTRDSSTSHASKEHHPTKVRPGARTRSCERCAEKEIC